MFDFITNIRYVSKDRLQIVWCMHYLKLSHTSARSISSGGLNIFSNRRFSARDVTKWEYLTLMVLSPTSCSPLLFTKFLRLCIVNAWTFWPGK